MLFFTILLLEKEICHLSQVRKERLHYRLWCQLSAKLVFLEPLSSLILIHHNTASNMTASNEILNQSSETASEEAAWKKLRQ
jgi:hypothetical protein